MKLVRKMCLFNRNPLLQLFSYIMSSKEETKRSHSAMFFNTFRKYRKCSKQSCQPPSKNQWEESDNPIIFVNQESTATLVKETINEGNNFLSSSIFGERKKKFLDWYTKLKGFSLILMKDIVKYCSNTIKETGALTNSTEASLKRNMEKEEYRNVEEVILQNEETTRCKLKQWKFNKFNYLSVGIKGSWFVSHKAIFWSNKLKICKTSTFRELFFPKYLNSKIISADDICVPICLELNEWCWIMKEQTSGNYVVIH